MTTEELETLFMNNYHNGYNNVGQIVNNSILGYIENNDMFSDFRHLWTLYGKCLLGDPALDIPQQIAGTAYDTAICFAQNPTYVNSSSYPVYHQPYGEDIIITSESNSPSITFKLTNGEGGNALETINDNSAPFEYTFQPESGPQNYILRAITEDKKEGWFHFYTTTGPVITDGDRVDWELAEIEPLATDSIDFDTPELEVTDLYVTNDDGYWYFAFTCTADTSDVAYGIAIDCSEGGYTGIEGVDQDAMGNWITFGEENGVNFEIYIRYYSQGHISSGLYEWQGGLWDWHYISYRWDSGYDPEQNFVEIKIPTSTLNYPETLNVILFSTLFEEGENPAQDSAPSDPATYHTLHWGQENANTLTNFTSIISTSVENQTSHLNSPSRMVLLQNYPNPFNPTTTIAFTLPERSAKFALQIYDLSGRLIKTLIDKPMEVGYHAVIWDGADDNGESVSSGVYLYKLKSDAYEETKRMILLK